MFRSKKTSLSTKQPDQSKAFFPSLNISIPSKSKQDLMIDSPAEFAHSSSIISSFQSFNTISPKTLTTTVRSPKMKELTPLMTQINEKNTGKGKIRRKTEKEQCSVIPKSFLEAKISLQETGLNQKVFFMYQRAFLDIVAQDMVFGSALSEVKAVYDQWVIDENFKLKKETSKLKKDLDAKTEENRKLFESLEDKKEENKKLFRNLRILSDENFQLGNKVQELTSTSEELKKKFLKITQVSVDNVSNDKESWQTLINCNKEYEKICKKLTKQVNSLEKREKKMIEAWNSLKSSEIQVRPFQEISPTKPRWDQEEIRMISESEISESSLEMPRLDFEQLVSKYYSKDSSDENTSN